MLFNPNIILTDFQLRSVADDALEQQIEHQRIAAKYAPERMITPLLLSVSLVGLIALAGLLIPSVGVVVNSWFPYLIGLDLAFIFACFGLQIRADWYGRNAGRGAKEYIGDDGWLEVSDESLLEYKVDSNALLSGRASPVFVVPTDILHVIDPQREPDDIDKRFNTLIFQSFGAIDYLERVNKVRLVYRGDMIVAAEIALQELRRHVAQAQRVLQDEFNKANNSLDVNRGSFVPQVGWRDSKWANPPKR